MKRATRTQLALALALLVGLLLILVQPRADERAAREAFQQLARALEHRSDESLDAREARLRRELAPLLDPAVRVTLPGGEVVAGRDAVIAQALELGRGRRPAIALRDLSATRHGKSQVQVSFEVVVSDSQAGDLHAAARAGRASLVRGDGSYRLERLELLSEARAEPEPRP